MNDKIRMKSKNNYLFSLITPLMILISFLGLTFRENSKKYFYVPIGIIGFYLIAEREYNRKITRKNILNKIKNFSRK
tara:strand:- start:13 stop:243 length:231 start_codon:yes stop_codon:yes gene_type:complete